MGFLVFATEAVECVNKVGAGFSAVFDLVEVGAGYAEHFGGFLLGEEVFFAPCAEVVNKGVHFFLADVNTGD